jgi:hypothetical protein
MNLWIFDTETLLQMYSDAKRVASCKGNDLECHHAAEAMMIAIVAELQPRGVTP